MARDKKGRGYSEKRLAEKKKPPHQIIKVRPASEGEKAKGPGGK